MMALAISLAGHDKGHIYYVLHEDDRQVILADGELKTIAHPKKKNHRHVQMIRNLPAAVLNVSGGCRELTDLEVKRAIKLYRQNGR